MLIAFFLFYLLAIWSVGKSSKLQIKLLVATCLVFVVMIGSRNPSIWDDTDVYVHSFQMSPTILEFNTGAPIGFAEPFLYILGCLVKVFSSNYTVYLTIIASIAMFLLYKSMRQYCIFPLLGMCDYVARFMMNRDFMQIRSSICILLIIYSFNLIKERKRLEFFLIVLVAYFIHHMAIIAIPFYFICNVELKKHEIIGLLIAAFLFAIYGSDMISDWAEANSEDLDYSTYVTDEYRNDSVEQGLANPLIYVQVLILLIFVFMENRLKSISNYYIFRNGYLYASLIMIVFSQYTALSTRTSAMFTTLECFILPMILLGLKKDTRSLFYILYGIVLIGVFYMKFYSFYHANNPDAPFWW